MLGILLKYLTKSFRSLSVSISLEPESENNEAKKTTFTY